MPYNIGVDLGGTNIVAGLINENNQVIEKVSIPTNVVGGYESIIRDISDLSHQAAAQAGIDFWDVFSIGVTAPGITNKKTGIIEYATNLFWHNVPLTKLLSEASGKPVYIENDANAAAYGEYIAGAAQGTDISMTITLGTGVGGGLILNGSVYTGFNFAGVEVGHIVIKKDGRLCNCGRHGCFERYASASGLIITAREYMQKFPDSFMWELTEGNPDNLNGRIPFTASYAGDEAAGFAVNEYIEDLACGLINLINIFQPDIICIGGGIAGEGEKLLVPLRSIVAKEVYSRDSEKNTRLVIAKLGNDAGMIGAANLYREV